MLKNFYELEAWQKAFQLTLEIYKLTVDVPKEETYGISSQMRRAASSIMANIAEGFERYHTKDRIKFYYQARGSASEVVSFLYLANGLAYMSSELLEKNKEKVENIMKLLNGLIRANKQYV